MHTLTAMTTITARGDQPSVRVVLRRPGGAEQEVELTLHHPSATAADLVEALRPHGSEGIDTVDPEPHVVRIDGRPVPLGLPLRAGPLRRGSIVELDGTRGPSRGRPSVGGTGPPLLLRTVAGPDAGRELPLSTGAQVVGRGRDADLRIEDPTLARYQAVMEVDADGTVALTDLGAPRASRIGAAVVAGAGPLAPGDELVLGATAAVVVRTEGDDAARRAAPVAAGPQWTVPLHRPPRPPAPAPPEPVRVPAAPSAPDVPAVAGSAAVVVTLVAGALIALVLRQPPSSC